jgi:tetratricopeptide (TPR) repeat protein
VKQLRFLAASALATTVFATTVLASTVFATTVLASTALATAAFEPAAFDRVITHDNRVLECKKVREEGANYRVEFEHGVLTLAKDKVKAVEVQGDMSDYVPKDDDERAKLAQGYVKYRGRWLSKPAYQDELAKEAAASKKRADDIAAHADWHSAWMKETKHFVVRSNTSPELLDYYCELLEAFYDLMDERFKIKPSPTLGRTKMDVHIYKNREEFQKFAKPGSPGVAGYFNRGEKPPVLTFFHNYEEPSMTEWVGLHECTHLLTYLIEPQYYPQIWLNEAVADYFGSSDISRDKKGKLVVKPGAMQADRLLTVQNAIKDGNDTKLDKLFELEKPDFDAFQYAHAWSFVYFLNESGPKYQKGFNKFFKDLYTLTKGINYSVVPVHPSFDKSGTAKQASPEEIKRVVLAALGVKELATLEKEWKDWIAAIELTGPDQLFKRAYMQIAYRGLIEADENGKQDIEKTRKNAEQALADLDKALAGGCTDPRAHWARHEALDALDRDEEARAAIETAIQADPLNGKYHWDLGHLLYLTALRSGVGVRREDGEFKMPKPSEEAAQCFRMAIALAPDNDGYRSYFATLMGDK